MLLKSHVTEQALKRKTSTFTQPSELPSDISSLREFVQTLDGPKVRKTKMFEVMAGASA